MAKTKKLTRRDKEQAPKRTDLIQRVAEAKDKLPASGITSLFLHKFPLFDTVKKRSKLNNVLQFRASDEDITKKLEELVLIINVKTKK